MGFDIDSEEILISSEEAMKILGVSKATLYRRAKNGDIKKPINLGCRALWPLSEIRNYRDKLISTRAA